MKRLVFLLCLGTFVTGLLDAIEPPRQIDFDSVRDIPILEGGRHKPLDTFAGETLREITGRWNFNKTDPLAYLFAIMTSEDWYREPLVRIDYLPLKEILGVDSSVKHLSYAEISSNPHFQEWIPRVSQKVEREEKLNRLENEIATLYHKLMLFQDIQQGNLLTLIPPSQQEMEAQNLTIEQMKEAAWLTIQHPHGYPEEIQKGIQDTFTALLAAVRSDNGADFARYGEQLRTQLAQLNPQLYPPAIDIAREISYNHTRPFLKSWIYYLLAFLLFLLALNFQSSKTLYWGSMGVVLVGFAYNSWGLVLRSMVSHRPPVSNMYESVVFVGWGIILFALIFEAVYRERWFGIAASILGVGTLVMADILPFDPNIEPLVPVLRSNYWLIVHVLTITLSYSAFALGMGLAHINLGIYFYLPHRRDLLSKLSLFLYRTLQVGTLLLAAGTILGGVWAAESWGRFWGWDPKETWALISLLGYMAILHARHTNWVADFGTAVCAVVGFWLILMTWYGVNFVLATGLHSYGFGSGGGIYVLGYMILETLFLFGVAYKYHRSYTTRMAIKPVIQENG